MTKYKTKALGGLNPNMFGVLPDQKPVHPKRADKIFAKRKIPQGIYVPQEEVEVLADSYPSGSPSIEEQARALRNDVDLIYQFVHDNIEFLPNYGLHKGGLGTLIDGSGNAFDQTDLMVKLLTAANSPHYTNIFYVLGTIRLSATQWSDWLGFDISSNVDEALTNAVQLLANGGIPVAGLTSTKELLLNHCWLKVNIDGISYVFDPSVKSYTRTTGIGLTNLGAALGYDRTDFLARAKAGSTRTEDANQHIYAIRDINESNINADLTTFSMNFAQWIKDNNSGASLADILGGKKIIPVPGTIRQTSLSYHDTTYSTFTTNVVPTNYKAYMQVQYDPLDPNDPNTTYSVDEKFATADIYTKRLTLWFGAGRKATLYLNGTAVSDPSRSQTAGTTAALKITATHPYPDEFADGSQTTQINAGGQTVIGNTWGWSSKQIAAVHQEAQNQAKSEGTADSAESMLGQSLLLIWDNFMGQGAAGVDILGRIADTQFTLHHFIGTVTQFSTGSGSLKIISSFFARYQNSKLEEAADIDSSSFTSALFLQSLEGSAAQQVNGIQAADAITGIKIANSIKDENSIGIDIFDAKASNWTTGANVRDIMANAGYAPTALDDITDAFINQSPSWRVAMPATATIPVGSFSNFYFYIGISPENTSVFTQTLFNAKGAVSSGYQADDATNATAADNARQVNGFGMPAATASESARVNLLNGRYEYSSTDLTVGNQGAPYELSFVRSYNSSLRLAFQGLGFGWSHNWLMTTIENSDGYVALGDQQVSAAAAAIATLFVLRDVALIREDVPDNNDIPIIPIDNFVVCCIVQTFLSSQMSNNVVRVQDGASTQVFAKMPDGSYSPGIGMHGSCTLTKTGSPEFFTYESADKVVYSYRSTGEIDTIAYPFGITISFSYHNTKKYLTKVSNGFREINFSYDTYGQLTRIDDGNSREINFTINSSTGNLTAVSNPKSETTTYEYDQRGRLTKIFKPAYPTIPLISNVYDSLNRVKEQTDAFGNLWQFFIAGNRSEELAPDLTSRTLYFNARGNTVRSINALGEVVQNQFDGMERSIKTIMPEGNSMETQYDKDGNVLATIQHAKGGLSSRTTTFTYDPVWVSKVRTITDASGRTTTTTYAAVGTNGAGQIVKTEQPTVLEGTPTTRFSYNSIGQILEIIDPTGKTVTYTYDPAQNNQLSSTVDSAGLAISTSMTYDSVGNVITTTDPLGYVTTNTFDQLRRVTQVTGPAPANEQTFYTYNANGNVIKLQALDPADSNSQTTVVEYAADGKVIKVVGPANYAQGSQPTGFVYEYDNLRRLSKSINSKGEVEVTTYDALSRPLSFSINSHLQQNSNYTSNGLAKTIIDAKGNITEFQYDGFDRLVRTIYPDLSSESVDYDLSDNPTLVTLRSDATIAHTYDALNRLKTKTPQGLPTIEFSYDLSGRLLSVSKPSVIGDPSTGIFILVYDSAGRLIEERYPDGKVVAVELDKSGNSKKLIYPDGNFVSNTFDSLQRLSLVSGFTGSVAFTYDSASRRISQLNGNSTGQGYFYDKVDSLLSMSVGGLKFNPILPMTSRVSIAYAVDELSHRVSKITSDQNLDWKPTTVKTDIYGTANSINQYSSLNGVDLNYDSNGCLTSDGTSSYTYDVESKLVSALKDGVTITFKYDPFGRLIEKNVAGVKTTYVYAGYQRIEEYNSSGILQRRYIYGDGLDECLFTVDAANSITYLHAEENGSIILATDSSGMPTARNCYSPWGEMLNGSLGVTKIGFAGQFYEPELDIYYFKARHYSPKFGRFLQPDPIGFEGGLNLYEYVGSDPINYHDPLGLDAVKTNQPMLYGYISNEEELLGNTYSWNLQNTRINSSYLRPNINQPGGLYGSGGGGYWSYMNMLAYMLLFLIMQQRASQSAQPPTPMPAPPPPPPPYLKQGVAVAQTIFGPGIENIKKDPLTYMTAMIPFGSSIRIVGTMNPALIRFTQNSIGGAVRTSRNGSWLRIHEAANLVRSGKANGLFDPIRIFKKDGVLYSLDNRRLMIYSEAGKEVPFVWATKQEIKHAMKMNRFSTTKKHGLGQMIEIRKANVQ